MKQVFLIILLLLAVLAGYLFFFEPETLDQLVGKKDQPSQQTVKTNSPTKNSVTPKTHKKDQPKTTVRPPAILNLPQDGMRYYVNGKAVSGSTVELPAGNAVVTGFREGNYRHEHVQLKSGQSLELSGSARSVSTGNQWDTFQGGSLRSGFVQAGNRQKLDVAWKGHMGHKVQSSPILANSVAFFASSQHLLNAVDLTNGKLLWSEGSTGSSVTPIVNGNHGFAGDNLGAFTGFRIKDGKPRGTARLDSYAISLGRISEEAFMAVTRSNTVYSIQTRKGIFGKLPLKVNWDREIPELRGSQAAPVFTQDAAIFQTEGYGLLAINLSDGSRLWPQVNNVSSETFEADAQSFVRDDVFLTPTPASDGTTVFGIQDESLVALKTSSGKSVWQHNYDKKPSTSLTLAYGVLFYGAGDGTLRAHSAQNGAPIYSVKLGEKPIFASPVVFADKLLVATGEGNVLLLDAFSGEILAKDSTLAGSGIDATPAVTSAGMLVVNRRGDLAFYR